MTRKIAPIFLALTLFASVTHVTLSKTQQRLQQQPRPWTSAATFPAPIGGIADPDQILSETSRNNLAEMLRSNSESNLAVPTNNNNKKDENSVPVQMAIAIVERLNTETAYDDRDVDEIVEKFARQVHDQWGVGFDTPDGGTGVLVFLDVYDRVVYISRGGALDGILSNSRIDRVIQDMRPALKQAKYEIGLSQAIQAIVELIEQGEPTRWERFVDFFFSAENMFVFVWIFILINGILQTWRKRREQRAYAQVASQLSELDRAQAEALQGNYHPQTSCPICLESFESDTLGSDGQPIKLLRCGHVFDESCWSEWVSSGRGDVMKCPVCRMDVGASSRHHQHAESDESTRSSENISISPSAAPTAAPTMDQVVVDETSGENEQEREQLLGSQQQEDALVMDDPGRARALRLYQQERNFRLLRLSNMYSRYVTSEQVMRWSSPTYNGQMVRDPSFASNDPTRNLRHPSSTGNRGLGSSGYGGSGFSSGFGGGRSSGGRAGRF
mmetsp:Transcript_6545/g.11878  ORF Transcript_6545/g.11878 Transcript_6545/m.11878 type:complete len:500 (-) Transcript_6545:74-1573(-)